MSDAALSPTRANAQAIVRKGATAFMALLASLFVLSMIVPVYMKVGSVLLMPHRALLLVAFFPTFFQIFILRRCGGILSIDWLMLFSAGWAAIAIFLSTRFGNAIEPSGVYVLEFFGAYMFGRVAFRSSADFLRFARVFFIVVLVLLPFALLESVLKRPVLLDLLPFSSVRDVDAGLRLGLRRAQTVFPHPILFGVFVSSGLGIFWYTMRKRIWRYASVMITGLATMVSLSAGAFLSFSFQVLLIGWELVTKSRIDHRWRLFAILAACFYVLIDLLSNRTPFHVLVTYATFSTNSAYTRILIWQHGLDNVWENPLFGLGVNVGDWSKPGWLTPSVDNFWLLTGMTYGLPSVLSLVAAVVLMIRKVAMAPLPDPVDAACRAGYLTAVGGICMAGATVHLWHAVLAFVMLLFGSGLWTVTGGAKTPDASDADPAPETADASRYSRFSGPPGANRRRDESPVVRREARAPVTPPRRARSPHSW